MVMLNGMEHLNAFIYLYTFFYLWKLFIWRNGRVDIQTKEISSHVNFIEIDRL